MSYVSILFVVSYPLLMAIFVICRSESESSRNVRYVLPTFLHTPSHLSACKHVVDLIVSLHTTLSHVI